MKINKNSWHYAIAAEVDSMMPESSVGYIFQVGFGIFLGIGVVGFAIIFSPVFVMVWLAEKVFGKTEYCE